MQFSLKSIMALVFAVCVACGIAVAMPGWGVPLVLQTILLMVPSAVVIVIIYGRGKWQAFAIGVAVSYGVLLWKRASGAFAFLFLGSLAEPFYTAVVLAASGFLAVWVRTRLAALPPAPPVAQTHENAD